MNIKVDKILTIKHDIGLIMICSVFLILSFICSMFTELEVIDKYTYIRMLISFSVLSFYILGIAIIINQKLKKEINHWINNSIPKLPKEVQKIMLEIYNEGKKEKINCNTVDKITTNSFYGTDYTELLKEWKKEIEVLEPKELQQDKEDK